ncbi:MAG: stage V sporulation protein AD [Eubacteriales bacterium]|nr:stage V sporulation protein AD [Eubacteriales bacterium]
MQKILKVKEPVCIFASASCVGHEEHLGPLGDCFDFYDDKDKFGAKTWELAEGELGRTALAFALKKAKLSPDKIDLLFAGDLQNQCVASSGGLSSFGIPYIGLYGACSTLGEGLICATLTMCAAHELERVAVVTTSHNCAAERQFRLPIEYGGQRPPTAQWTATAGGAFLISRNGGVKITELMPGVIVDGGISDANNMGAAMAPAAARTISDYFSQSTEKPSDFDAIITGDLAKEGSEILTHLLSQKSITLNNHRDCGMMIYDYEKQDVHSGGSGCGCSASVLAAYFLPRLVSGEMKKILLVPTGALMSTSSIQQGGTILGIAPLVRIEHA